MILMREFSRLIILGGILTAAALLLFFTAPAQAANAPTGLTASAGDTQVTLTWNAPNDSTITGYQVLQVGISKLVVPDTATDPIGAGDRFGDAVGVDNRRAAVGAPFQDTGGESNVGQVHMFSRGSGGWSHLTQRAFIAASADDNTGASVAVDGRTVVAGVPEFDYPESNSVTHFDIGRMIIYHNAQGNNWAYTADPRGEAAGDQFGNSVSVDGGIAVVGAPKTDVLTPVTKGNVGTAYVYARDSSDVTDNWSKEATLTASDRDANDRFGWAVAVEDDTIVVGAEGETNNRGAAYVFVKPMGAWATDTETAKLTAPDGAGDDAFGSTVAVDGDFIVVGARGDDDVASQSGSVYVFTKPNTTDGWGDWDGLSSTAKDALTAKLTASDAAMNDRLGWSVAVDGDTVLTGAYWEDAKGANSGSVYLFTKPSGSWVDATETVKLTAPDGAAGDEFGYSVAAGRDRAIVGAPGDESETGAAYVFSIPEWTDISVSDDGANISHTATGLDNGVEHTFLIRPVVGSNPEPASGSVKATPQQSPAATPTGLSALGGDAQVTLSWNDPNDSSITGYEYQQKESGTFGSWITILTSGYGEANSTGYTVTTGVDNGKTYTFRIRAVDEAGDSTASNQDSASTLPAAPATLMAAPSDGQVTLSWDDPDNASITKYQYNTDGGTNYTDIALADIDSTSDPGTMKYTVTALVNGRTYTFTLRAVNSTGNGGESALTVAMVPPAPTGLTATGGDGQVALSWDDPNDTGITGYQYSTDGGTNYTDFALTAIDSSETGKFKYTIKNLPNGVTYNLALRAVNASGNGGVATETALMVPAAPAGLSAMPLDMMAQLTWDDPSNNDTITNYKYSTDDGVTFTAISGSGADTTGYTVTSLTNGVTYTFKVRAVNNSGDGPASTAATATPMPVPAAPTGLKAIGGNGQVTLSWDDPNDTGITGYQYSTDGGTNYTAFALTDIDDINENTFGYTVTGLTNGVTHTLALRAVNAFGNGMPSTVTALMVPAAPELSAAAGDEEVALSWADPGNATITRYEYSTDDGDWADISGSDDTTTSHTVAGLTNYQAYSFQIRAVNETGIGPASNSASATPRIGKPAKPTDLSAQAGDSKVMLQWDAPVNDTITGYQISEVVPEDFLTATGGAAGAHFGISVAIDGDTAVVGADRENDKTGSAYIFTRDSATGEWSREAKLDGEAAGDQFGWSVAVDGDTVVVGAHAYDGEDDGGNTLINSGSAYVFTRTNGVWTQQAKLTAAVPEAYAFFGGSVALHGSTLVIGSRLYDAGGYLGAGAAYVFTEDSVTGAWSQAAKLTASDGFPLAYFGYSVAVDGDTVLVGAFGSSTAFGRIDYGSAYVFAKRASGWADGNETTRLTASNRQLNDYFGFSVALDGDTGVIGARLHNDPDAGAGSGAAYVFTKQSGVWGEKAKLTPSDAAAGDNFGVSVAVEGDTVVVGSWKDDDNGRNSGSAYVFTEPDLGWASTFETTKFTDPDGAVNDRFGWSVAVDLDADRDDLALVGAYSDDHDVGDDGSIEINAGSVHVLGIPDWYDIDLSDYQTTDHTVSKELDDTDTDLTNGTEYAFQIRALNQSGAGPASDGVSETPLGPPATLGTLNGDAGDTNVKLSWAAAIANATIASITEYEYSTDGGITYADIPGSGANTTRYTVTTLTDGAPLANGTSYDFAVRAVNVIGAGLPGTVEATPADATPAAPVLNAEAGDTQVRLMWNDPQDFSVDRYQYQYEYPDPGNVGSVITFPSLNGWNWVPKREDRTIAYQYTVAGLTNDVEYTFRVRAVDEPSDFGAVSDVKAKPTGVGLDASNNPVPIVPNSPTELKATGRHEEVGLTWDDPDDASIDKYQYQQLQADNAGTFATWGADWTDIPDSNASTTEYIHFGLTNGVNYRFRIRAVDLVAPGTDDDEFSNPSDNAEAIPWPHKPGAPTDLNVTARNQEVTLTWRAPPGSVVDKYEVLHLQASELAAPNVAKDDKFGYSVAIDGDIAVVGAYRDDDNGADSGAAYVFTRSGGVEWDEEVKLTASDGAAYDNFGISVAVDGDTLVVGAPGDDDNGADSGSVYVFTRDPDSGEWRQGAKLTASDGDALDYFGYSVAVSGNTVLVGAYLDDDENNDLEDSGSAYVFVEPAEGWVDTTTQTTKLTPSEPADDDQFGISVALDGNTAVIGAPGHDYDGVDTGSAYVFVKPDSNAGWADENYSGNQTAKLTPPDFGVSDYFGVSVALDGDTVVVGAWQDDYLDDPNTEDIDEFMVDSGSTYVFTKPSGGWTAWDSLEQTDSLVDVEDKNALTAKLTASDGEAGDYFGYSVAVGLDTILVGAYGDDENGSDSGSAYVFTRDPVSGLWSQTNKLTEVIGEEDGRFGYSVAVDAAVDTALVGAGSAHIMDIHDWEEVPGEDEAREYTFRDLTNDQVYDFQVRAVNLAGEGGEAKAEAEPEAPGGGGGSVERPERDEAPVNSAPRFSEGDVTSRTVPEDSEIGTGVGSPLSATDSDGDPLQYSLSGVGQTYFQVDPATGQLMTTASLNYESQSEYSVQVTVDDDNGGRDVINVTIAVLDVDEPPSQPGVPQVSSASPAGLAVSWRAPANQGPEITDYDVQYREVGGGFQDAGYGGAGTSVTVNDLRPGTIYEVQVRAINAEGTGPWSESGRGETEGTLPTPVPTPTPTGTPIPTPDAGVTETTPVPTPEAGAAGATPVPTPDAGVTETTPAPTPVQTQVPLKAITELSRTALTFLPAATLTPSPTPPSLAMLSPTVGPTPEPPPAAPLTAPADDRGFSFYFNLLWILLILLLVAAVILTARLYTVMRRR